MGIPNETVTENELEEKRRQEAKEERRSAAAQGWRVARARAWRKLSGSDPVSITQPSDQGRQAAQEAEGVS